VKIIIELETLAVINSSQRVESLVIANVVSSSIIIFTLKMKATRSSERRFLQEPHGVTAKKAAFYMVTAAKTSNKSCIALTGFAL
jgi:hypothetical protein